MRIAVAYLFQGEAAARLNELRQRYDQKSAAAIDAHVTLAAPIMWDGEIDEAAQTLQGLLRPEASFDLVVDGIGAFLPASPTCFAIVAPRDRLTQLHDLIVGRLGSNEKWPFVPHATITEFLSPRRTAEVVKALGSSPLRFVCRVEHLSLLKQVKGGRWQSFYDLPLGGTGDRPL